MADATRVSSRPKSPSNTPRSLRCPCNRQGKGASRGTHIWRSRGLDGRSHPRRTSLDETTGVAVQICFQEPTGSTSRSCNRKLCAAKPDAHVELVPRHPCRPRRKRQFRLLQPTPRWRTIKRTVGATHELPFGRHLLPLGRIYRIGESATFTGFEQPPAAR